jgi:hypothetical protein
MPQIDFDHVSKAANLSEAIYAHRLPVWSGGHVSDIGYEASLTSALTDNTGDNAGNNLPHRLAESLASNFRLLRSIETEGFTAGVFEDREGQLFLAIRGTSTRQNVEDDAGLAAHGTAKSEVEQMANFWNEHCKDLHGRKLVITGHSLGGAESSAFARLFPDNAPEIITFNSAGVSDHAVLGSPPEEWWKPKTNQPIDIGWGAEKTTAFSTDSGHSGVHLDMGPIYHQVGEQQLIPYAEKPKPSIMSTLFGMESHSMSPLNDAIQFEKVAMELGLPRQMAEVYIKNIGEYGPQALYNVTDQLAIATGASTARCASTRDGYFEALTSISERAPALHGKIVYLGEHSADELTRTALTDDSPHGSAVRAALLARSPVGFEGGQNVSAEEHQSPEFWRQKAEETLKREQLALQGTPREPGLHAEVPVPRSWAIGSLSQAPAVQLLREGLGASATLYTDNALSSRWPPEVAKDIQSHGFPDKEVTALHSCLQNEAGKNNFCTDAIDRVAAFDALVHISKSDSPLAFVSPTAKGASGEQSQTMLVSAEIMRAAVLGREAALPTRASGEVLSL